ncbi:MAG: response regulator [Blastochloris sp.]|nr:response regulator [Blastochloris sp.]
MTKNPDLKFKEETPVFLYDGGKQMGPMPFREARQVWESGKLSAEAFFWAGGMKDWLPMEGIFQREEENPVPLEKIKTVPGNVKQAIAAVQTGQKLTEKPEVGPVPKTGGQAAVKESAVPQRVEVKKAEASVVPKPPTVSLDKTVKTGKVEPERKMVPKVEAPQPKVVAERKHRVLVVDDDMLVREMIGDLLDQQGILWDKAEDMLPARKLLEQKGLSHYDAVVTDYQTPGGSGVDLVRWIKQRENALQVLLLTAKDDKEVVKSGLRAGVMDFLDKPVRRKSFLPSISQAITQTSQLREERAAYLELIRLKLAGRGGAAENLMTQLVHRESSVGGLLSKLETVMKYSEELEKKNAEVFPGSNVYVSEMPFQGQISDLSLLDLAQLLSQSGKTGELQVLGATKIHLGSIYFDEGRLTHAEVREGAKETGHEALVKLMSLNTGYFCFQYGKVTVEASLFDDPTSLLLAVSAEMDEGSKAIAA